MVAALAMARLRRVDEANMPSSCAILHTAPGTVNNDGSRENGTVTTTTVACRFVTGAGMEALLASRLVQEADAVMYVPLATAVDVRDTVTYLNDSYQVLDTNAGQSFATSLMLTLKLVK